MSFLPVIQCLVERFTHNICCSIVILFLHSLNVYLTSVVGTTDVDEKGSIVLALESNIKTPKIIVTCDLLPDK